MSNVNAMGRAAGRRAVVIGGSMAGLMAARVLSDHFDEVALVERDPLPDSYATRKGVPQGRQPHVLLQRGEQIIEQLFPGICASLIEGGAVRVDFGRDVRWFQFGGWKHSCESGMLTLFSSRPYLEGHVRRRVLALPAVRRYDAYDVTGFDVGASPDRVTGVSVRRRDNGAEETLAADLVVDAGGRGSQTPKWLEALGYERPVESVVGVDIKYTSRVFRREKALPDGYKALYIIGKPPESKRLGLMIPIEDDRWIAVITGMLGDHPPNDPEGYMTFARALPVSNIYEAIKDLEPLTDPVSHKFPASLRRRYERLRRLPEGLVVLGDALCSFNPVYGQGMTMAAVDALALDESLREQGKGSLHGLAKRYFTKAGKATDTPWMMTTGEDFRYPEVQGDRPLGLPAMEWYMSHVHQATASDPEVFRTFVRALHLVGSPLALFDPRIALRVLLASRQGPTSEDAPEDRAPAAAPPSY